MKRVAKLLKEMIDAGIITNYAVFGAVAQMRYTEAIVTLYADILIAVPDTSLPDILSPIYAFCREKGYFPDGEAIRVGDWPVQFLPAFNPLTEEAMAQADVADLEGIPLRAVRAGYLAVIALSVGRAKDFTRILALQEAGAVEDEEVSKIADRHGLFKEWQTFRRRFHEV